LLFFTTAILSFRRPSWAVALYMLTFFLAPPFWWWGKSIAGYRWNLFAGLMLFLSVWLSGALSADGFLRRPTSRKFIFLAVLAMVNATAVHFLLAPNLNVSSVRYALCFKLLVLFVLTIASIRDEVDLKIVLLSIVLGACYIGYEVTINDRGKISGNRLEGVGVPNASTANDLACLMVSCLPLVAPLFLFGPLREKALAAIAGPFILNVVLMCNSRGAFLALIGLGIVYLIAAPRHIRPQVYKIAVLGLFVGWMLLGDPRIVERFLTTFSGAEERDQSATSRMGYWKAGLMMIADHPLGAGGDGFKRVNSERYIAKATGSKEARSVHQGYINEACEWGLQGLAIRLAILGGGLRLAWRTSRRAIAAQRWYIAGTMLSVVAGLTGLMIQSFFGTFLDDEWALWLVALAIGSDRILDDYESGLDEDDEEVDAGLVGGVV
jgi:putative inorganic carbon (HCO3(-)) transporter